MAEYTITPDGFDKVIRESDRPIKIVNKTGHDLKFVKTEEGVYFLYIDDPT